MSDNKRTPQIRFKGFTDDWEQRKLNQFSKYITSNKTASDIVSDGLYDLYDANNIIGKINNDVIKEEYITIIKDGSGVGKVRRLPKNTLFIGTMGGIIAQNSNIDFIYCNLLKTDFTKEINGATIPHVYYSSYGNNDYYVPSLDEQKKIGMIFNNIDNLITLHQRKLEKLNSLKKSMLEKMFPKNSEKVPEIRFKGFTDDWEQRKLDKLLEQYTEVTIINDQYPALTSSRKGIFFQTEYFAGNQIASQNNVGYNIVPRNYFTYRHMSDDEIFHFNINNICDFGIVSTLYPVFTTKKELDSKYLQYQLNYGTEFAKFATLQKQGGSRTYMYFAKLRELELTIPKIEEQKKISAILSNVDNLITLQQRKLEKLNSLKKSMLEKMFI